MVCRNVWFRGRFGEGQIPLRSASDAQASRVVVVPSLGINSLMRRRTSCRSFFDDGEVAHLHEASGISMWLVVWSDLSFVGL